MAFFKKTPNAKPANLDKNDLILCVGWHAFVNWPQSGRMRDPVPLVDANGETLANDLLDGQEVEIMAWRPHGRGGLSYQIRRVGDVATWWIRAIYLRRNREPAAAAVR